MSSIFSGLSHAFFFLQHAPRHYLQKLSGMNFFEVESILQQVYEHATRGDPESVIKAIDELPGHLMNIGLEKGLAMEKVIEENKPKILVELGGYFGYSAIRLANAARKHNSEAHYYSIELNPVLACVIESLVKFAGLADIVTVLTGNLAKTSTVLREDIQKRFRVTEIDFLLLDHWKDVYVSDLKLARQEKFFKKGTVIVADNIFRPGVPEYKKYMEEETDLYTSTLQKVSHDAIFISYVN